MNKTSYIIEELMEKKGLRRKRDVAEFFGVTPQALSTWIARGEIPPKHLLKILIMEDRVNDPEPMSSQSLVAPQSSEEMKTVIDYLMRENQALKNEVAKLKDRLANRHILKGEDDIINKINAESLIISGNLSSMVIEEIHGEWLRVMGYEGRDLIGHRIDRREIVHPEDFDLVEQTQKELIEMDGLRQTRFSTVQRWKHGQTGDYVLLSMVLYVDKEQDRVDVVAKPIDSFFDQKDEMN